MSRALSRRVVRSAGRLGQAHFPAPPSAQSRYQNHSTRRESRILDRAAIQWPALLDRRHGTRPGSRSLKMLKNPSKCESIDPTAVKLHGEINTPFTVSHYSWVLNELGTRMVEDAANVVASSYGVRIVARKFGATARKACVNPNQVAMSRDRAVSAPFHQ
jgi:hypothetical protein